MKESPKGDADQKSLPAARGPDAAKPRTLVRVVLGMALLAGLVGLGLFTARTYILNELQTRAAERGVELWPGELKAGFFYLALEHTRFRTLGPVRVDGTIGRLRFEFEGLQLQKIRLEHVEASGRFSRGDLRARFDQPAGGGDPGPKQDVLMEGEHITISLAEPTSERPWLLLRDFSFERQATATVLNLPEVWLWGVNRGSFTATATESEWRLQRVRDRNVGAFDVAVNVTPEEVTADVQFSQVSEAFLFGGASSGVNLKGSLHAKQLRGSGSTPIGDLELVVDGIRTNLPGTFGLGSLGSTVSVRSPWALDANYETLHLSRISVNAGPLLLAGTATVQHLSGGTANSSGSGEEAQLIGRLRGSLSCQELTQAILRSELGAWFGNMVSKPASRWVNGSVQIELSLESKLSALSSQSPRLTVGIGCGLKAPAGLDPGSELMKGAEGLRLPTTKDLKWLQGLPDLLPTLPDRR
ncbi:MAG: hypothetical protein SFV15_12425 [Polyangiaceae bacterium]|nr:hypothetical protein [Polyangiaceae bacterium]